MIPDVHAEEVRRREVEHFAEPIKSCRRCFHAATEHDAGGCVARAGASQCKCSRTREAVEAS